MTEYTIFIQNGSCPEFDALPYPIKSFNEVYIKLLDMISLEEKRRRPYFVENKFFDNKHSFNYDGKLFIVKSRNVTDWEICFDDTKFKIIIDKNFYLWY